MHPLWGGWVGGLLVGKHGCASCLVQVVRLLAALLFVGGTRHVQGVACAFLLFPGLRVGLECLPRNSHLLVLMAFYVLEEFACVVSVPVVYP